MEVKAHTFNFLFFLIKKAKALIDHTNGLTCIFPCAVPTLQATADIT